MIREVFQRGVGYVEVRNKEIFLCNDGVPFIKKRMERFLRFSSSYLINGGDGFYLILLQDRTGRPNGMFPKSCYQAFWNDIIKKFDLKIMMYSRMPEDTRNIICIPNPVLVNGLEKVNKRIQRGRDRGSAVINDLFYIGSTRPYSERHIIAQMLLKEGFKNVKITYNKIFDEFYEKNDIQDILSPCVSFSEHYKYTMLLDLANWGEPSWHMYKKFLTGNLVITYNKSDVREFYYDQMINGIHWVYLNDSSQLVKTVKYYQANPALARKIGREGCLKMIEILSSVASVLESSLARGRNDEGSVDLKSLLNLSLFRCES